MYRELWLLLTGYYRHHSAPHTEIHCGFSFWRLRRFSLQICRSCWVLLIAIFGPRNLRSEISIRSFKQYISFCHFYTHFTRFFQLSRCVHRVYLPSPDFLSVRGDGGEVRSIGGYLEGSCGFGNRSDWLWTLKPLFVAVLFLTWDVFVDFLLNAGEHTHWGGVWESEM